MGNDTNGEVKMTQKGEADVGGSGERQRSGAARAELPAEGEGRRSWQPGAKVESGTRRQPGAGEKEMAGPASEKVTPEPQLGAARPGQRGENGERRDGRSDEEVREEPTTSGNDTNGKGKMTRKGEKMTLSAARRDEEGGDR